MTLSMYSSLVQAQGHAEAHDYDATLLLDGQLYPDMFPLKRHVQITSDIAKKGVACLAGLEASVREDKEATVAELLELIDQTIAYIDGVAPEALDAAEDRTVCVPLRQSLEAES